MKLVILGIIAGVLLFVFFRPFLFYGPKLKPGIQESEIIGESQVVRRNQISVSSGQNLQEKKSSEEQPQDPKELGRTKVLKPIQIQVVPEKIVFPKESPKITSPDIATGSTSPFLESSPITPETKTGTAPKLKPLDETSILKAVVKIECPADGGKYIGSGFAVKGNIIVTAAHVIKDSISEGCTVIFPYERKPIHYLKGVIANLEEIKKRHDEQGVDFALLKLPTLDSYPEAKAIYGESYPYIPYPACSNPKMLGDKLLHFGYPSNYADQNYLSRLEGEAVASADIKGIKEQLSQDQSYSFKSPVLGFTYDEEALHSYMVSRVASFYGDSGGLAFNATQQCILGPHRGGTIGREAGENFSVFINMGWGGIQKIIGSQ